MGDILEIYWAYIYIHRGCIGDMLGLYIGDRFGIDWFNGKENGNYYSGLYRAWGKGAGLRGGCLLYSEISGNWVLWELPGHYGVCTKDSLRGVDVEKNQHVASSPSQLCKLYSYPIFRTTIPASKTLQLCEGGTQL